MLLPLLLLTTNWTCLTPLTLLWLTTDDDAAEVEPDEVDEVGDAALEEIELLETLPLLMLLLSVRLLHVPTAPLFSWNDTE
jgi:hypothetical protein